MKPARTRSLLASLLLISLIAAAPSGRVFGAQQQTRERRAAPQTPAVRPTPTPAPASTKATPARPTPTPAASQTPTPAPTPQPTPAPAAAPQTLEDLRARIRDVIARPEFAASHVAVKVASLDTGRVLFEQDARK